MSCSRSDVPYTANYCEENVYKLASLRQSTSPTPAYVVYITNKQQRTPLWAHQRGQNDEPVVWDYHVVYMELPQPDNKELLIYDHDSVLQFPEIATNYIMETFRPSFPLRQEFKQYFRVIPVYSYLNQFSSDRSHMVRDGVWLSPPPEWSPIRGHLAVSDNTFPNYLDMDNTDECYGRVMSLSSFVAFIEHLVPEN